MSKNQRDMKTAPSRVCGCRATGAHRGDCPERHAPVRPYEIPDAREVPECRGRLLAFYLTRTADVPRSSKLKAGVTDADILKAAEILRTADEATLEKARKIWNASEADKAAVAAFVLRKT